MPAFAEKPRKTSYKDKSESDKRYHGDASRHRINGFALPIRMGMDVSQQETLFIKGRMAFVTILVVDLTVFSVRSLPLMAPHAHAPVKTTCHVLLGMGNDLE